MHRTIAAALVSALMLGLASCGGTDTGLTRAQLVAKVDAACAQARQVATQASPAAAAQSAAAAIAAQHLLAERLRALNPADAAKRDFDAFRQDIQQLSAIADKAAAGKAGTMTGEAATQGRTLFKQIGALSKRLGLTGCI